MCRPGGTIGRINFTPEGLAGDLFRLFARYAAPRPPAALPPVMWGREEHVGELFGDRVASLDLEFATRANRGGSDGPAEYPYEYLLVVARKRNPAAMP